RRGHLSRCWTTICRRSPVSSSTFRSAGTWRQNCGLWSTMFGACGPIHRPQPMGATQPVTPSRRVVEPRPGPDELLGVAEGVGGLAGAERGGGPLGQPGAVGARQVAGHEFACFQV